MKFCLRIFLLLLVVTGTLTEDGFDLGDVLDPTPAKPQDPKRKNGGDIDLTDLLGDPDPTPPKPQDPKQKNGGDKPAVVPPKNGGDIDLADVLGDPDRFVVVSPKKLGGGVGMFKDSDFTDIEGDYKPDRGHSGDPNPTKASGGNCQLDVIQKLSTIIENQNRQLRLLQQIISQPSSSSSRLSDRLNR